MIDTTDQRENVAASFNIDFLAWLEYYLSGALQNSTERRLKYLWCDGIDDPPIHEKFSARNITSMKQIETMAWFGETGQDRYKMILQLGRWSRKRALKGRDLRECLPETDAVNWVEVDELNYSVTIKLK